MCHILKPHRYVLHFHVFAFLQYTTGKYGGFMFSVIQVMMVLRALKRGKWTSLHLWRCSTSHPKDFFSSQRSPLRWGFLEAPFIKLVRLLTVFGSMANCSCHRAIGRFIIHTIIHIIQWRHHGCAKKVHVLASCSSKYPLIYSTWCSAD